MESNTLKSDLCCMWNCPRVSVHGVDHWPAATSLRLYFFPPLETFGRTFQTVLEGGGGMSEPDVQGPPVMQWGLSFKWLAMWALWEHSLSWPREPGLGWRRKSHWNMCMHRNTLGEHVQKNLYESRGETSTWSIRVDRSGTILKWPGAKVLQRHHPLGYMINRK